MTSYLKDILIILYVLINYNIYYERLLDLGFSLKVVVYLFLFILILLGLLAASNVKNNKIRIFYGFILFLSALFVDAYVNITSDDLTYDSFISLINATGFIDEAIIQYNSIIIKSFVIGLILLVGISIKPKLSIAFYNRYLMFVPILVLISLSAMLYIRGGDGAKGLPPAFTPLAFTILASYESMNNVIGEREEVNITRKNEELNHDIVLIIDESISANYLDVNTAKGVNTSLNNNYKNINIYNYGYSASITNCSSETNVTLRYGGTRNDYLKIITTKPSLWRYAKNAKMTTVYIDAQRTGKKLQNEMTKDELEDIDVFIQFDDVPVLDRDIVISDKLIEIINNETHDFVIINKIGAHFPVHDKYPDHFMKYKPVLPRGGFLDISDTGSREGYSGNTEDWLMYRNSYRNTILWNVGEFFKRILDNANLNNAVIIYTSDHGQDLHERGNPGVSTHCSPDPYMEEGLVPLLIIEGASLITLDWNKHYFDNKNNSSHYNIFPTLLSLMLYEPNKVSEVYGNGLNLITNDNNTFNARFHSRLGKMPIWKKIEVDKIIVPNDSSLDNSQGIISKSE